MTEEDFNNENLHEKTEEIVDEFALAKHSVKHKRLERKIRKKRKRVNRLKGFLRFVVTILLLYGAYHFFKLPQWYLPQDAFTKKDGKTVEIINNSIVPTSIIYEELQDVKVPRIPIFLMSVRPIKKEIFKIPVVKYIYVRRYGFPARIQIIIRERVPVAVIKTDLKSKPVAFFTADGVLVSNKNYMGLSETKSALKILTNSPKIDGFWTVKKVEEISNIVKAVESYSGQKVEYVDMKNPNDVYVKIQTTSIRLGMLDSTVYERIKRIYTILPQIGDMGNQAKYIDLSWDKVNYLKLKKNKK